MEKIIQKIAIKLRYPKLLLLCTSIFVGYLVYTDNNNFNFHEMIGNARPYSVFFWGMMFSHGFTAGPAVAALLIIGKTNHLIISGIIASAGMLVGNAIVYQKLRLSCEDEFDSLSQKPLFKWTVRFFDKITPSFVRRYILPAFAGILNATPLPDEFSAALVHASRGMSITVFMVVSFIFSAFGIFFILAIGRLM